MEALSGSRRLLNGTSADCRVESRRDTLRVMTTKRDPRLPRNIPIDRLEPSRELEPPAGVSGNSFTMVKCKCLPCGLHFVLCTWYPERHSTATIFCPECGRRGGGMLIWHEHVDAPVSDFVPGTAQQHELAPQGDGAKDH